MIDNAVTSGARKEKACEEIGLSIRTLQRWQEGGEIIGDKRPIADRPQPPNKLTEEVHILMHRDHLIPSKPIT
ncbi:hypothetical protein K8B83_20830 [Shewanella inventionis]|uniref:hypothetical protein n=1 Tax=Shewanella inventionis TaxID=1738770 RepID=UPI001CBB5C81|nr:hypothetical protein [Shewanella inventionis]UAL43204.1 hypothetical protein K8B83_20830 [Shewanella inventionis]